MTDEHIKEAVIKAALEAENQLRYLIEKNFITQALPRQQIIKLLDALIEYRK